MNEYRIHSFELVALPERVPAQASIPALPDSAEVSACVDRFKIRRNAESIERRRRESGRILPGLPSIKRYTHAVVFRSHQQVGRIDRVLHHRHETAHADMHWLPVLTF